MDNGKNLAAVPDAPPPGLDLGDFRLVRILPGAENKTISCFVESFSLYSCPNYIALSYFCGVPSITETIFINGSRREVTTNLASFLRLYHLGDAAMATELCWIDTICIYLDRSPTKCCRNLGLNLCFVSVMVLFI